MSPLHKSVEKAGIEAILKRRRPYAIEAEHFFGDVTLLKENFARVIGSLDSDRIAIVPSVSYGISNVTNNINLKRDEEIILVEDQFPSNVYPWMGLIKSKGGNIRFVSPEKGQPRGASWNRNILEQITDKTRVVAMPHIHWADGTKFDLIQIRKRCNDIGALLVIDGTQSIGALPFDFEAIQPDALICAGYKWLMGPYSFGLAYYGEYFDKGTPIENNWINRLYSEDFKGLVNYQPKYQPGAARYSVGEHSNFNLVPMMQVALQLVDQWSPAAIQEYCKNLVDEYLPEFRDLSISMEDPDYRANHILGLAIPEGIEIEELKQHFHKMKVSVSFRGNSIRVSPNIYNDSSDLATLLDCLKGID
jgi:selenocysteine lyase/cysteine desulfurase